MSKTAQELAQMLLPRLETLVNVQYLFEHSVPSPDQNLLCVANDSLKSIRELVHTKLLEH